MKRSTRTYLICIVAWCFASCETEIPDSVVYSIEIPAGLPTAVQASLEQLPSISDMDRFFEIIIDNINALALKNRQSLAAELLDEAVAFAEREFNGLQRINALITLSSIFSEAESVNRSIELLENAYEIAQEFETTQEKSEIRQAIISQLIEIGNEAVDLLPRIIIDIYTIRDLNIRSQELIETAIKYQNNGDSANTLLQQAIPAIAGIEDELIQAQKFSLLAPLFIAEENEAGTKRFYDEALEKFKIEQNVSFTDVLDKRQVIFAEALVNLAQGGYDEQALELSELLIDRVLYFNVLLNITRIFYENGDIIRATDVIERINSALDSEVANEHAARVLLALSQIYFESGNIRFADIYAERAELRAREIVLLQESEAVLLDILVHFTELGNVEKPYSIIEDIRNKDRVFRAYVAIVRNQFRNLDDIVGVEVQDLVDLLELAFIIAADNEEQLSEVAVRFAELGRLDRAVEIVAGLSSPYYVAQSLTQLYAMLSDEQLDAAQGLFEGFVLVEE